VIQDKKYVKIQVGTSYYERVRKFPIMEMKVCGECETGPEFSLFAFDLCISQLSTVVNTFCKQKPLNLHNILCDFYYVL